MIYITKHKKTILFLIYLVFLSFVIPSINDTLILDETNFAEAASSVVNLGTPKIYANLAPVSENIMGPRIFIYHLPLYVNLLASIIRLFGLSTILLRGFSLLLVLTSSIVVYLIARKISSGKKRDLTAVASVFFFLFNPLTIKNASIVGLNGTVLMLSVLLFSYFFILKWNSMKLTDALILGFLMAVVIWSKMEGFTLLTISLFIFYFIKRNIKEAIIRTVLICFIGIIFSTLIWIPIASLQGVDFWAPLINNLRHAVITFDGLRKLLYMIWSVKNFLFWMTPSFLLLGFFVVGLRIVEYLKGKRKEEDGFLVIFVTLALFVATIKVGDSYGFPTYVSIVSPLLSLIISNFLVQGNFLERLSLKKIAIITLISSIFLVAFNLTILGDPLIDHNIFWTKSISLDGELNEYIGANIKGILFLLPIPIILTLYLIGGLNFKKAFVISSVVLIVVNSVYLGYVQTFADYSTTYVYGQEGFQDTIDFLRDNLEKEDTFLARLDFCYHVGSLCHTSYPLDIPFEDQLKNVIENDPNLEYIVMSPSENHPALLMYDDRLTVEGELGHFKIYRFE